VRGGWNEVSGLAERGVGILLGGSSSRNRERSDIHAIPAKQCAAIPVNFGHIPMICVGHISTVIESDPFKKPDWRTGTTAAISQDWVSPWTGTKAPKGSHLTVVSIVELSPLRNLTIEIPNATALMLNASARAFSEAQHLRRNSGVDDTSRRETSFDSDGAAFDFLEQVIAAVLLGYTSLEAFANESVPDDYVYARHDRSSLVLEASGKETIERYVSLDEKLTKVLPDIFGSKSPKGRSCWPEYRALKSLRDRLIHMKTKDRRSPHGASKTLWQVVVKTPAPHLAVTSVLHHFLKSSPTAPGWYKQLPF
jgi:hypothetical protein